MAEREYTHPELGEEIRSISGYYAPNEEQVLPYHGREVLLVLGFACVDSSCCGTGSWSYVQVPGFLVKKRAPGGAGQPAVSVVDTIEDKAVRDELFAQLTQKYPGARVEMW
jgi:hypothetical protein